MYMVVKFVDVLVVNEICFDDLVLSSEMSIFGYYFERNDCNRYGGGVVFYIRDIINYECLLNYDS